MVGERCEISHPPLVTKRLLWRSRYGKPTLLRRLLGRELKRLFSKGFCRATFLGAGGIFPLRSLPCIETVLPTYNQMGMPKTTRKARS